jgi:hypothetical protein
LGINEKCLYPSTDSNNGIRNDTKGRIRAMKLQGSIILEITRWCNLECYHCLRGRRQRKRQTYENISALLSNFKYVDTVTFTGGEPTLAPDIIGLFIDASRLQDVGVGNYYIATNAERITPKFLKMWERLHHWCDDNDISGLDISNDHFHSNNPDKHKIMDFAEQYNLPYHLKYDKWKPDYADCISEGRAKDWSRKLVTKTPFLYNIWGEDDLLSYSEGDLYLNCKGNIIHGCDWSFESQDKPENIISHVSKFKPEMLIELGQSNV